MVVALLKIEQVVSNVAVWILQDTKRPAVLTTGLLFFVRFVAWFLSHRSRRKLS